jgi:DNA-binding transcriptional regulator WhiA
MTLSLSAANTSCAFYTIEMECLKQRLNDLQAEVQDTRRPIFSEFTSKLHSISNYFLETIAPLIDQFSIMKNMDSSTKENCLLFINALKEYNNVHDVTFTLIKRKGAFLLEKHARIFCLNLLKKSDAEVFSEGDTIAKAFASIQKEMDLMQKYVTPKNNYEAYECLKGAKTVIDFVKRDTAARRRDYFEKLKEELSPPYSISLSLRRPVVTITIFPKASKEKHDTKLMVK